MDDYLISAIQNNSIDDVKSAIKNGAAIRYMNDLPLKIAAEIGNVEIIELLLVNGADPHSNDNFLLKEMVRKGDWRSIRDVILMVPNYTQDELLASTRETQSKDIKDEIFEYINHGISDQQRINNYFDRKVRQNDLEGVRDAIEKGADIYRGSFIGAIRNGNLRMIKLIEQNIDSKPPNISELIDLADTLGHQDIGDFLEKISLIDWVHLDQYLFDSIEKEQVDDVRRALRYLIEVPEEADFFAAESRNLQIIYDVVKAGGDKQIIKEHASQLGYLGVVDFCNALIQNDEEKIQHMLSKKYQRELNKYLADAIKYDELENIKDAVAHGAKVSEMTLFSIVKDKNSNILKLLKSQKNLIKNLDVDVADLLSIADVNHNTVMKKYLVETFPEEFEKRIIMGILNDELNYVKLLLENGVNFIMDKKLWLDSIQLKSFKMIKYLRQYADDAEYHDEVLKAAVDSGKNEVIKYFGETIEDLKTMLNIAIDTEKINYITSLIEQKDANIRALRRTSGILGQVRPFRQHLQEMEQAYHEAGIQPSLLPEFNPQEESFEEMLQQTSQPVTIGEAPLRRETTVRAPRVRVTFAAPGQEIPPPSYLTPLSQVPPPSQMTQLQPPSQITQLQPPSRTTQLPQRRGMMTTIGIPRY